MSNWVAINAKQTPIDGDNSDASSSEVPTGQAVPTSALSSRCSTAMDTDSFSSPSPPVSHPYYSKSSPIPRPSAPIPWQFGPPQPYGPSVSNTQNLVSLSVPAALTQEPMHQSPHWASPQPAYRENIPTLRKYAAKTPRNTVQHMRPSADRVSDAIDLNTRRLVRLVSPQADGLINRLLVEHDTAHVWRSNVSEVSTINECAWKLMLETAIEELKVPICRLSTIGRALKDLYTESEISDEAKRSEPLLLNIKDLLDRIEQTLPLFADIHHIELALAGLRLKRVGLGNADLNLAHDQTRQGPTYLGLNRQVSTYPSLSSTQFCPDTPPPGRGLQRLACEVDEGFVQSRSGPVPPGQFFKQDERRNT